MSESKDLVPVEQREIAFYEDQLTAVLTADNQIYVPLRPICSFLGVQWSAQSKRIKRDPVLSDVTVSVSIMDTQSTPPQHREMTCLPLDFLNGWLFGINASRVKPEVREGLIRYQRECYRVLADAFLDRPAAEASPQEASLLQVREMGLAIVRMAEEQLIFDKRLTMAEGRLDQAATIVGDMSKRLAAVEQRLAPGEPVTDEQASQLSQAVKSVALKLGEQSGRNEYGGVYGELYRKFSITSYKLLSADRFEEAMKFLTDWHSSLVGDEPF